MSEKPDDIESPGCEVVSFSAFDLAIRDRGVRDWNDAIAKWLSPTRFAEVAPSEPARA